MGVLSSEFYLNARARIFCVNQNKMLVSTLDVHLLGSYHTSFLQNTTTMKLFSTVVVSSCLAAQAFGVTPVVSQTKGLGKPALVTNKSPLRQKNVAELSPLFRDPTVTRGGAIPGLQAYSDALDKNPITMKALTSLVGWFLGDLLAQVSAGEYDLSMLDATA